MRRNTFFALILTGALALTACGASNSAAGDAGSTDERDTFVIGLEAGYAPFNWTQMDDGSGAVPIDGTSEFAGGYDVEIAKRVAEGLGKELVVQKIEWDGLLPALTSGSIDAIVAGMSPNPERREAIDFTEFYYMSDLVMVVNKNGAYTNAASINDFAGAKVTGQLNTSHYKVIDQIEGVSKEPAFENFTVMRVALESGIIDAYVSERPEGISAAAANENFLMITFDEGQGFDAPVEDSSVSIGLQKGSELTAQINDILAGISEDERQEIMSNAVLTQPSAS